MTNVTILTDGNGVKREYHEVQRKANVGERIKIITERYSYGVYKNGDTFIVEKSKIIGVYNKDAATRNGGNNPSGFIDHDEYVVLEPTDIIHVDGVRYREEKREAKVGEHILIIAAYVTGGLYGNGSVLTVRRALNMLGFVYVNEHDMAVLSREYVVITPLNEPAPNNITVNLTVNVASSSPSEILKAIADSVQVELAKFVGEHNNEETRDKITEALTNKFRDEVVEQARAGAVRRVLRKIRDNTVERAKADLVELRSDMSDVLHPALRGRDDIYLLKGHFGMTAEFIVNKEKRTVVCLLRGAVTPERIYARGIAKCAPDDCFNVHIGKAIALRRALGLDVPSDYLNAPQPTEPRIGDVVVPTSYEYDTTPYTVYEIDKGCAYDRPLHGWVPIKDVEIIDDSRDQEAEVIA